MVVLRFLLLRRHHSHDISKGKKASRIRWSLPRHHPWLITFCTKIRCSTTHRKKKRFNAKEEKKNPRNMEQERRACQGRSRFNVTNSPRPRHQRQQIQASRYPVSEGPVEPCLVQAEPTVRIPTEYSRFNFGYEPSGWP